MSTTSITGVGHLLRLVLRRDRLRLPLWVVGLGGTIVASALAVPPLYDTSEKIAGYARTVGASPVSYLMSGRQVGLDTLGGIVANEISQVAQLGVCLMVVFLVVRHTRAEEESGRAELLRSAVLGRHAATLAGLVYGVAAALVIGAVTTISMLTAGLAVGGSLTYGVGLALLGVAYTAITLGLAWAAVALITLQVILGQLLGLPDAVQAISPFWHLAAVPVDDFKVIPYLSLIALATGLVAAGLWGYRRRNTVTG